MGPISKEDVIRIVRRMEVGADMPVKIEGTLKVARVILGDRKETEPKTSGNAIGLTGTLPKVSIKIKPTGEHE